MNKNFVGMMVFLAFCMVLGLGVTAAGLEYAADITITDAKKKVSTGKIYMKGEKIRQEMTAENGVSITTILRIDLKVSWTLMEGNKYMEVALPADPNNPETAKDVEYEKTVIGTETVNGYECPDGPIYV